MFTDVRTSSLRGADCLLSFTIDNNYSLCLLLPLLSAWDAEGGRRTNRFSRCSQDVWVGSSCSWLCIKHAGISWLCFGVATWVATCFFTGMLIAALLHDLACALLHAWIVFKEYCSSDLGGVKSKLTATSKTVLKISNT